MKKAFIILLMFLSFFAYSQSKAKYFFKIATDAPDKSAWINCLDEINKEMKVATNGEIDIKVYPASTMGDQNTVVNKMKIGQLNGAGLSSGGMQLIYKDFGVLGFPLIFRTYDEYDYTIEKLGSYVGDKIEENGFVLLAWTEVGLIYVFSKKKVNSLATLKTSKPFLLEGDVVSKAMFDEFSIKPIPLQMADIVTSLQTGMIDTVFSSYYTLIATQWYTRVAYGADFPITLMIGAIVVDKKIFESMPKNYQTMMRDQFASKFKALSKKVRQDDVDSKKALEKYGIKYLPVADKEKEVFQNACDNVYKSLTEKEYSRDLLIKVQNTVEEYRKGNK